MGVHPPTVSTIVDEQTGKSYAIDKRRKGDPFSERTISSPRFKPGSSVFLSTNINLGLSKGSYGMGRALR